MEFSAVNRRRPSRETPLGPGAKKDGCFRRLEKILFICFVFNLRKCQCQKLSVYGCFSETFKRCFSVIEENTRQTRVFRLLILSCWNSVHLNKASPNYYYYTLFISWQASLAVVMATFTVAYINYRRLLAVRVVVERVMIVWVTEKCWTTGRITFVVIMYHVIEREVPLKIKYLTRHHQSLLTAY